MNFIDEDKVFGVENNKTSCVSGKQNLNNDKKLKQQFCFNRVRMVPDQPNPGHLQAIF